MFGLPSRSAMVRDTAHERNIADGVVRRTERPRGDDRGVLVAVETVVEGMGHVFLREKGYYGTATNRLHYAC